MSHLWAKQSAPVTALTLDLALELALELDLEQATVVVAGADAAAARLVEFRKKNVANLLPTRVAGPR